MGRLAGRNGRLYIGLGSAGTAEAVPFIAKWSADFNSDRYEVTAMGDTGKAYVQGLPDAKGTYSGFLDDATAQMYTAAVDGVARKMYLYVDTTQNTKYIYGTAFFDFSIDTDVGGSANISGSWAAATTVQRSW